MRCSALRPAATRGPETRMYGDTLGNNLSSQHTCYGRNDCAVLLILYCPVGQHAFASFVTNPIALQKPYRWNLSSPRKAF